MLIDNLRGFARPPARWLLKQARLIADDPASATEAIAGQVAPLDWVPLARAPVRVNVLIPTIDLAHFFGGYIAAFNLARRLAEQGHRVRMVTVDTARALPPSWRHEIEGYDGLSRVCSQVEIAFGREAGLIEVSPADHFIATTWWSAHIAAHAVRRLGREGFGYLIQEYEPFTFPMGTLAALAAGSYTFPHVALFSSELLRDYFRRHQIGVYAADGAGDEASLSFQNAITTMDAPTIGELAGRRSRKLLFYARPEQHAARNMFELGVLALTRAVRSGALDGWELFGIGAERGRTVRLGRGTKLHVLPRCGQRAYADRLREHDVGLALTYTPHPSLVPIEMAAAGMVTVTNTFENKTAAAMRAVSPNLLAVPPTIDAVAAGICAAARRVDSVAGEHRLAGSKVAWSRDWQQALPDRLLARFTELLNGQCAGPPMPAAPSQNGRPVAEGVIGR
jgi:hypothetical protein